MIVGEVLAVCVGCLRERVWLGVLVVCVYGCCWFRCSCDRGRSVGVRVCVGGGDECMNMFVSLLALYYTPLYICVIV